MTLFLTRRFYLCMAVIVLLFVLGYVCAPFFMVAQIVLGVFLVEVAVDICMLYFKAGDMHAERQCSDRFSNGDSNEVLLSFVNPYPFRVNLEIIDEVPIKFQMRDFVLRYKMMPDEQREDKYYLIPTERGEYTFDRIRLFFSTRIGLVQRRFTCGTPFQVKVYPSYSHLSLYGYLAIHHRLNEYGVKRIRHVGEDTEFDQIKDYVPGDEYRNINWKASARTGVLKVNVYQQERSQDMYCIIDKGRMMQQVSQGLTFLEHAINASLALSYVAVKKDDRAGILSFAGDIDSFISPSKNNGHMQMLMESLYKQQTIFSDSDYSQLAQHVVHSIPKRSLMVLFANFSTLNSLTRELPFLMQISSRHKLIVVVFRDREMDDFSLNGATDVESIYQQVCVEHYIAEKNLLIGKLHQAGIATVFTYPENLSVNVINKYIEIRRF